MIRYSKVLFALAIVVAGSIASAQMQEFAPNRVLVKFRGTPVVASYYARNVNAAIGAQEEKVLKHIETRSIRVPNGMNPQDALAYYRRQNSVVYAELDHKREPTYIPNDPRLPQQYGPTITKCPQAWDLTKGSGTVIIAIIDSGIEATHEDFAGKLVPGWDFSDNDPDPDWTDSGVGDHGVHVAGIAAAATDNGKGGVGTGFNCKIMPLKIFPNSFASVSAAAIIHAADNGAKVINMSYGGGFASQTELDAVNYAWSQGVVLCAASGNNGSSQDLYPAKFPNVIAVGATDSSDLVAGFTQGTDEWVDVLAPGVNVLSTTGGNTYNSYDGTSMASPMAAGIVGLIWSMGAPGTTAAQVRQALESTTDPISNNNGKSRFGRVNAFEAVKAIDPGSATISPPVGVGPWFGNPPVGAASDLLASDGNFVSVTSTANVLGQVGGISVGIDFNGQTSNLRESLAFIEANGPTGASGQLFLWHVPQAKYVLVKAFPLRPTGVKRERISLPLNLAPYVDIGGNMTLGIRAIGPNRVPRTWRSGSFDFNVGFVSVSTRPLN